MDTTNEMVIDIPAVIPEEIAGNMSQIESLNQQVYEIVVKVEEFEKKLNEVEQFYSRSNAKQPSTAKGSSILKEKDGEKLLASFKMRQQGAGCREATAAKRMQELMRQFATILRNITEHQWAEPFMLPVDVVGLGLQDYYEVIEKPMDFSTIKSKMEAKYGTGYKHVREICADVRLIFKNAMKYNHETTDVHAMAKYLLDKFETKWLRLLPKVDEEEKRQKKEEEAEMQFDIQLAHEAALAKAAKALSSNLVDVEKQLQELRESVLQNCRKMSTEEKIRLGSAITRLSSEEINKALEIVAQNDPNFQAACETVEIDMGAQSELTLWKLKFFVKDALEAQMKNSTATNREVTNNNQLENSQNKRRRDMTGKTSQKRSRKLPN